ncbi:D-threo-aldose 1-dehydrogenase [Naumannella cuiyingiana]|uniref:D-threo-aldose 1-dehydrogenase n=1 Tax=Naumannella cuiyingiana TaxID=1347891 RepID=A0A7Z0DBU6_9ACTN|nr:D-threo-aldose 1-dehydrogenase [Naumannella cuiyingiana]
MSGPAERLPALPAFGLGGAGLGNLFRAVTDEAAESTLRTAWDGGVRLFDTAPHYGLGLSERRFGRVLGEHSRSEYLLSTKVGRLLDPVDGPVGDDLANGFDVPASRVRRWDASRDGIRRSLDASRERLGIDEIDLAFLHDPDENDEADGLRVGLPALAGIREDGEVRAVGVGSKSTRTLIDFVAAGDLDVIMMSGRYTLLEQPAAEELLPLCLSRGVAVIAVSVYNSGLLASLRVPEDAPYEYGAAPRELIERARRIAEVCERHGTDLPTAALHFPLRHPAIGSVIVGAASPEQARSNVDRMAATVPDELWPELVAAGLLRAELAGAR